MIKINLNKTKQSAEASPEATKITELTSVLKNAGTTLITTLSNKARVEELNVGKVVKAAVKLIVIACFPLSLKFYEINQITQLESEKVSQDQILSDIQKQLGAVNAEIGKYGWLQEKSKEYVKKKEFLKSLAEKRLVIPRTIDFIQNNTPATVWWNSISLNIEKDQKKISIKGESFNESYVNSFANSLHDVVDKNSITVSTRDMQGQERLEKVQFDLMGEILF